MSNYTRKMLVRGLLSAACCGVGFGGGARAQEPGAARSGMPKAAAESYLLLTDGRLIKGVISQNSTHYLVQENVGVVPFPKRQVERAFDTVREAFAYRLERVPEEDPAERLRLA